MKTILIAALLGSVITPPNGVASISLPDGGFASTLKETVYFSPDGTLGNANAVIDQSGGIYARSARIGNTSQQLPFGFAQKNSGGGIWATDGKACATDDPTGNACASVMTQYGVGFLNAATVLTDGGLPNFYYSYENVSGNLELADNIYPQTYPDGGWQFPDGGGAGLGWTVQTYITVSASPLYVGFSVPTLTPDLELTSLSASMNMVADGNGDVFISQGSGLESAGILVGDGSGLQTGTFAAYSGQPNTILAGANVTIGHTQQNGTASSWDTVWDAHDDTEIIAQRWAPGGSPVAFMTADSAGNIIVPVGSITPGQTLPTCSATYQGGIAVKPAGASSSTHLCYCVNTGNTGSPTYQWASVAASAGATLVTAGGSSTVCP